MLGGERATSTSRIAVTARGGGVEMVVLRHMIWGSCSAVALVGAVDTARGADIYVKAGAVSGTGTQAHPLGTIQEALDLAQPGDRVVVSSGNYKESLQTRRSGDANNRIILEGAAGVTVRGKTGPALTVEHDAWIVRGIAFDGDYTAHPVVVAREASSLAFEQVSVSRSYSDCLRLENVDDVTIGDAYVFKCIDPQNMNAVHGIFIEDASQVWIQRTNLFAISGAGILLSEHSNGWDDVFVVDGEVWGAALDEDTPNVAAGVWIGHRGIDVKQAGTSRPNLAVENVTFRDLVGTSTDLDAGASAISLDANVDALVDRVTVADTAVGIRLTGPSFARVQNLVAYRTDVAFDLHGPLDGAEIYFTTLGLGVPQAFRRGAPGADPSVENLLLVANEMPGPALAGLSNQLATVDTFEDAQHNDYYLRAGSDAWDAGTLIEGIDTDRQGEPRPHGEAVDVGAYEGYPDDDDIAPLDDCIPPQSDDDEDDDGDDDEHAGDAGKLPPHDGALEDRSEDVGCGCRALWGRSQRRPGDGRWFPALVGLLLVRRRQVLSACRASHPDR